MKIQEAKLRGLIREMIQEDIGLFTNQPRSRMRKISFVVREGNELVPRLQLSEDYIVNVLGVNRQMLRESIYDSQFQAYILREHLLFEGWWSDAIDAVKEKLKDNVVTNTIDAAKELGSGIAGVTGAMAGIVSSGGDAIVTVVGGAKDLMSKGLNAVKKVIGKITAKLDELSKKIKNAKLLSFVKKTIDKLKGLVDFVVEKIKEATDGGGWKSMLAAIASYLTVAAVRNKIEVIGQKVLDVLSNTGEKMWDAANSLFSEFKSDDDAEEGEDAPEGEGEEGIIAKTIGKVKDGIYSFVWGLLKKVLGESGVAAIESLAGPVAWIKKLGELFQKVAGGVAWVCERIIDAIKRATFKPLKGSGA